MRRAAKRDDSEKAIVAAIEAAGWTWIRVSDAGLFDGFAVRAGVIVPGEIKTGNGKLTPRQVAIFAVLAGAGVTVHVWRTPLEALAVLGCTAVEARRGLVAAWRISGSGADATVLVPATVKDTECMLSEARQRLGVGAVDPLVPSATPGFLTPRRNVVRTKRTTAAYVPPRTMTGPCSTPGCEERAMPSGSQCTGCFLEGAGAEK